MLNNPKLYEINTRVWIKTFGSDKKLSDIPQEYWVALKNKGIDFIWLLGVWKTCKDNIESTCYTPELIRHYNGALKDWTRDDVIGSPYSIDEYIINPDLGTEEDILNLKISLNELGMALILDFVPNHFGSTSNILYQNPEIFLTVDKKVYEEEPYSYFTIPQHPDLYFAHGRDPFFPAWKDTAQINYFNPIARDYMAGALEKISFLCDGVRCAMSMLVLTNVFGNTWRGASDQNRFPENAEEFWFNTIKDIKSFNPGFIFMAETYWNLEHSLQKLGFDYTYDKVFYDKLKDNTAGEIRGHLTADMKFQQRSMRFIEKHDEDRALHAFGHDKSMAAAVITATVPGLTLYQDGQWEGKKQKLPLQLGREPMGTPHPKIEAFYNTLLKITSDRAFKDGVWELLFSHKVWDDNLTNGNILAWRWKLAVRNVIVAVNYSPVTSQCRLKFKVNIANEKILLNDLLSDKIFTRSLTEVNEKGLYIDLPPYNSHIFIFNEDSRDLSSSF
jgi:hypothetical protein